MKITPGSTRRNFTLNKNSLFTNAAARKEQHVPVHCGAYFVYVGLLNFFALFCHQPVTTSSLVQLQQYVEAEKIIYASHTVIKFTPNVKVNFYLKHKIFKHIYEWIHSKVIK